MHTVDSVVTTSAAASLLDRLGRLDGLVVACSGGVDAHFMRNTVLSTRRESDQQSPPTSAGGASMMMWS